MLRASLRVRDLLEIQGLVCLAFAEFLPVENLRAPDVGRLQDVEPMGCVLGLNPVSKNLLDRVPMDEHGTGVVVMTF